MIKEKIPRSITVLSSLYPLAVLSLAPEIANSFLFSGCFVLRVINHSSFGRTMERHVGLGLLFSMLVYVVIFFAGLATLAFVIWMTVKAITISRGLLDLSEKTRRAAIAVSSFCSAFIICTLLFFNYDHLAGKTHKGYSSGVHPNTITRTESARHKGTNALDIMVLSYFALSAFYFSRGTTKALFKKGRRHGEPTAYSVLAAGIHSKLPALSGEIIPRLHRFFRGIGKQLSAVGQNILGILENQAHVSKNKLKTTFKLRKGEKPAVEKFISIMGWTNLLLILLAFTTKCMLLFGFMSAGWAGAIRLCMGLFSMKGWPTLAGQDSSHILIMLLGTAYALYHLILILLLLVTMKKETGANVDTYLWGLLSAAILITFTKMGFGFRWT